jgi:uncharacterized protein YigE (DUF2233 family)
LRRLAAWLIAAAAWALAAPALAAPCEDRTFEGARFTVCPYAPQTDRLQLAWRGRAGPLGGLAALREAMGGEAARVEFAMNAGMYDQALAPLGLFVVDGRVTRPLNKRSSSFGNFYLKPNGVFWVDRAGAPHIDETAAYAAKSPRPRWATQSGPLLVQADAFNPQIAPNGPSELIRNGVGVRDGIAYFAISDDQVSFGRFARFFRDALGCPDALFLDGSVSSLWAPSMDRLDDKLGLGIFVVVLKR